MKKQQFPCGVFVCEEKAKNIGWKIKAFSFLQPSISELRKFQSKNQYWSRNLVEVKSQKTEHMCQIPKRSFKWVAKINERKYRQLLDKQKAYLIGIK